MKSLFIPEGYSSSLDILKTERAIELIKNAFESELERELNLTRVSAPLLLSPESGFNDNLPGKECQVQFNVPKIDGGVQVVQSLAKWKRYALHKYGIVSGRGIYTDMNAIRCDGAIDHLHSVYVDQWDWALAISPENRSPGFLKDIVRKINYTFIRTEEILFGRFPQFIPFLSKHVTFITAQNLEDMHPSLTPEQREEEIIKKHGTVFVTKIGGKLKSGEPHRKRSPDDDDWELNGDFLVWNPLLNCAFKLASIGIQVNANALDHQLSISGCDNRRNSHYHQMLLEDKLPPAVGGGIGQSSMCMLLLRKAHIGEVHVSVWPKDMIAECEKAGVRLL